MGYKIPFQLLCRLIVFIGMMGACSTPLSQTIDTYEWKKQNTLYLPIDTVILPQQTKILSKNLLSFHNQFVQRLYLYDLSTSKQLRKVELKKELPGKYGKIQVFYHHFFNEDSLLLILNGAYHPRYFHDSLMLTYHLGKKKCHFLNVEQVPVISSQREANRKSLYWMPLESDHLVYGKQVILPLNMYKARLGDSISVELASQVAGGYHLENASYIPFLEVRYPIQLGQYYPYEHKGVTINTEKEIIVGFYYSPIVYAKSHLDAPAKSYRIPSYLCDTIPPMKLTGNNEIPTVNPLLGMYGFLNYHAGIERYYRWVRVPAPEHLPIVIRKNKPSYSLLFWDPKTQARSECLFPSAVDPFTIVPYQKGFLCYNAQASKDTTGYLVLDYYELLPKTTTVSELKSQLAQQYTNLPSEQGFHAYWKNLTKETVQDGNYLIVPVQKSCPPCLEYVLNLLCEKYAVWNKHASFRVILVGEEDVINSKLRERNCPKEGFILDTKPLAWDYIEQFTNFKLITVEEGEIIDERILNPADLLILQKLLRSLEEMPKE